MPGTYEVLAPLYDQIGMADFGKWVTPRLIDHAQRGEWMGRRVLDVGCGTGASTSWLCENRFTVVGVDRSPEMLQIANDSLDEKSRPLFKAYQQDIRSLKDIDAVDMALAIDVFNELESLREFEQAFSGLKACLSPGKLFVFDLVTIEGLSLRGQDGDQVVHDDTKDLTIFTRNRYDYERQIQTCHYIVFRAQDSVWERYETERVLRAYPIQAVATLLQRSGFSIIDIVNVDFQPVKPGTSGEQRVIFLSKSQ
jgi:SAM-dependent methyltransferase